MENKLILKEINEKIEILEKAIVILSDTLAAIERRTIEAHMYIFQIRKEINNE